MDAVPGSMRFAGVGFILFAIVLLAGCQQEPTTAGPAAPPAPGQPPPLEASGAPGLPGGGAFGPPPGGPGLPPPGGPGLPPPGGPGLEPHGPGPAEDPRSSWDPALASPISPLPAVDPCPDRDRDGFPDAWSCPHLPPDRADCDDSSPAVTPDRERFVRPGPFLMGSSSAHAGRDERPVHVVQLSGYCLDRLEVREADFAAWKRRPVAAGQENRPAEGVSREEALAWCAAAGKTLPTEAQWEKAARGGCELGADPAACDPDDLRPYPWGLEAPSCDRANHRLTTGAPRLCVGHAVDVDAPLNVGPYGHLQLAGNVWEWVADAYHPGVYRRDPVRVDPTGPAGGEVYTLRGGGWNTFSTNMRAANRFTSTLEGSATGFRCARARTTGRPDPVQPLELATLSGEVVHSAGALQGEALYVTAFDAEDADPVTGLLPPGRSPAAEVKLRPAGGTRQAFSMRVPKGGRYRLMAVLDVGPVPVNPKGPSGAAGFGQLEQPLEAKGDRTGVTITLRPPPRGGPGGLPPGPPGAAP